MALLLVTSGIGVAAAVPTAGTTASASTDVPITEPTTGDPTAGSTAAASTPDTPATSGAMEEADAGGSTVEAMPGERRAVQGSSDALDANQATITGQVFYRDRDGSLEPARQVEVVVQDKDLVEKFTYDTVRTDDRGRFTLTFDATDPDWGSEASVIVEAYADNPAAKTTTGALRDTYEIETQKFTIENGDTRDLGTLTPNVNNEAWQAADWALDARRELADRTDGWTRSQVRIQWPQGDWPRAWNVPGFKRISLPERSTAGWGEKTVHHEYGHTVMDAMYDGKIWKWPVPETDHWSGCHVTVSETDEAYAFIEGWAEFTEAAVEDDAYADGMNLESRDHYESGYSGRCFDGADGEMIGDRVEGSVASILWDLYDDDRLYSGSDDDGLSYSLGTIVRTVERDDVGNANELWDAFRTEENHAELRGIYFENGIVKPDRFEGETPQLGGDATVEAQISHADVDEFTVDLEAGEQLSADLSFDGSNADVTLTVEGPDGLAQSESNTNSDDEAVSLTASETGTYTVIVAERSSDSAPYTLDLSTTEADGKEGSDYVEVPDADWHDWGVFDDLDLSWFAPGPGNDTATCGDDGDRLDARASTSMGWSHDTEIDADCPVEIRLETHGDADLDLYLTTDGRTATPGDYDRLSASASGSETIRLAADERSVDRIGIGVEAYSGTANFTVHVEELDRDD